MGRSFRWLLWYPLLLALIGARAAAVLVCRAHRVLGGPQSGDHRIHAGAARRSCARKIPRRASPTNGCRIPAFRPASSARWSRARTRSSSSHRASTGRRSRKRTRRNVEKGRSSRGGSTITQQLAKNLFLSGERTWWRKAQEAAITVMIETIMSKRRILEIYLNVIEWGNGVFGAEAAARHHFGVAARESGAGTGGAARGDGAEPAALRPGREPPYLQPARRHHPRADGLGPGAREEPYHAVASVASSPGECGASRLCRRATRRSASAARRARRRS